MVFTASTRERLFRDSYERMETDRLSKFMKRIRDQPTLFFTAPFASLVDDDKYEEFWDFRLRKVWRGVTLYSITMCCLLLSCAVVLAVKNRSANGVLIFELLLHLFLFLLCALVLISMFAPSPRSLVGVSGSALLNFLCDESTSGFNDNLGHRNGISLLTQKGLIWLKMLRFMVSIRWVYSILLMTTTFSRNECEAAINGEGTFVPKFYTVILVLMLEILMCLFFNALIPMHPYMQFPFNLLTYIRTYVVCTGCLDPMMKSISFELTVFTSTPIYAFALAIAITTLLSSLMQYAHAVAQFENKLYIQRLAQRRRALVGLLGSDMKASLQCVYRCIETARDIADCGNDGKRKRRKGDDTKAQTDPIFAQTIERHASQLLKDSFLVNALSDDIHMLAKISEDRYHRGAPSSDIRHTLSPGSLRQSNQGKFGDKGNKRLQLSQSISAVKSLLKSQDPTSNPGLNGEAAASGNKKAATAAAAAAATTTSTRLSDEKAVKLEDSLLNKQHHQHEYHRTRQLRSMLDRIHIVEDRSDLAAWNYIQGDPDCMKMLVKFLLLTGTQLLLNRASINDSMRTPAANAGVDGGAGGGTGTGAVAGAGAGASNNQPAANKYQAKANSNHNDTSAARRDRFQETADMELRISIERVTEDNSSDMQNNVHNGGFVSSSENARSNGLWLCLDLVDLASHQSQRQGVEGLKLHRPDEYMRALLSVCGVVAAQHGGDMVVSIGRDRRDNHIMATSLFGTESLVGRNDRFKDTIRVRILCQLGISQLNAEARIVASAAAIDIETESVDRVVGEDVDDDDDDDIEHERYAYLRRNLRDCRVVVAVDDPLLKSATMGIVNSIFASLSTTYENSEARHDLQANIVELHETELVNYISALTETNQTAVGTNRTREPAVLADAWRGGLRAADVIIVANIPLCRHVREYLSDPITITLWQKRSGSSSVKQQPHSSPVLVLASAEVSYLDESDKSLVDEVLAIPFFKVVHFALALNNAILEKRRQAELSIGRVSAKPSATATIVVNELPRRKGGETSAKRRAPISAITTTNTDCISAVTDAAQDSNEDSRIFIRRATSVSSFFANCFEHKLSCLWLSLIVIGERARSVFTIPDLPSESYEDYEAWRFRNPTRFLLHRTGEYYLRVGILILSAVYYIFFGATKYFLVGEVVGMAVLVLFALRHIFRSVSPLFGHLCFILYFFGIYLRMYTVLIRGNLLFNAPHLDSPSDVLTYDYGYGLSGISFVSDFMFGPGLHVIWRLTFMYTYARIGILVAFTSHVIVWKSVVQYLIPVQYWNVRILLLLIDFMAVFATFCWIHIDELNCRTEFLELRSYVLNESLMENYVFLCIHDAREPIKRCVDNQEALLTALTLSATTVRISRQNFKLFRTSKHLLHSLQQQFKFLGEELELKKLGTPVTIDEGGGRDGSRSNFPPSSSRNSLFLSSADGTVRQNDSSIPHRSHTWCVGQLSGVFLRREIAAIIQSFISTEMSSTLENGTAVFYNVAELLSFIRVSKSLLSAILIHALHVCEERFKGSWNKGTHNLSSKLNSAGTDDSPEILITVRPHRHSGPDPLRFTDFRLLDIIVMDTSSTDFQCSAGVGTGTVQPIDGDDKSGGGGDNTWGGTTTLAAKELVLRSALSNFGRGASMTSHCRMGFQQGEYGDDSRSLSPYKHVQTFSLPCMVDPITFQSSNLVSPFMLGNRPLDMSVTDQAWNDYNKRLLVKEEQATTADWVYKFNSEDVRSVRPPAVEQQRSILLMHSAHPVNTDEYTRLKYYFEKRNWRCELMAVGQANHSHMHVPSKTMQQHRTQQQQHLWVSPSKTIRHVNALPASGSSRGTTLGTGYSDTAAGPKPNPYAGRYDSQTNKSWLTLKREQIAYANTPTGSTDTNPSSLTSTPPEASATPTVVATTGPTGKVMHKPMSIFTPKTSDGRLSTSSRGQRTNLSGEWEKGEDSVWDYSKLNQFDCVLIDSQIESRSSVNVGDLLLRLHVNDYPGVIAIILDTPRTVPVPPTTSGISVGGAGGVSGVKDPFARGLFPDCIDILKPLTEDTLSTLQTLCEKAVLRRLFQ